MYFVVKENMVCMVKLNHKPLFEIETAHNPKGLNAVSHVWDEALEN